MPCVRTTSGMVERQRFAFNAALNASKSAAVYTADADGEVGHKRGRCNKGRKHRTHHVAIVYSARSATSGSTRVARRAGI